MTTLAVIYARVSRAYKKDDDRVTIEAQIADSIAYCQEHGYKVVAQYVDKDKYRVRGKLKNPSGEAKDRPAYVKMIKAARNKEFDVIVAWKEDRLYRGMYAALPLSEALDECRNSLRVELVKETFDHKMLGIKAAIAKMELDNIRDRMVMGRRVRIERGEIPGGPIRYGYSKGEDNKLYINEKEAEVVQKIFEWYIQGENNMAIRRRLNASGILPRFKKVWSKMTIQNTLTFEGYATGQYTTTLDGETYTILCPPILSMSTWKQAVEVRKNNKEQRARNVKEDYLCRGMLVCPCGWKWGAKTCTDPRYKNPGKVGRYDCSKRHHKPEEVDPACPGTIGSKKVDTFVWNLVVKICKNPEIVQRAIDEKIALLQLEKGEIEAEADSLQRELEKLREERNWIITMARKGVITEVDLSKQLADIEIQSSALRNEHGNKLAAIAIQNQVDSLKQWADKYLRDIASGIQTLEANIEEINEEERTTIYEALQASQFEEKFNGDRLAALRWAILEEKRRTVRMLIKKILVKKGKKPGERVILPQLTFEVPDEYVSLVSHDQSLDYQPTNIESVLQERRAFQAQFEAE